jgi:hypothetical protein
MSRLGAWPQMPNPAFFKARNYAEFQTAIGAMYGLFSELGDRSDAAYRGVVVTHGETL